MLAFFKIQYSSLNFFIIATSDDADYYTITAPLLFLPGQEATPLPLRVPISNDEYFEGTEIFFADLMTDEERVTLDPNRTIILIIDDDSKFWYCICLGYFLLTCRWFAD